MKLKLLRIYSDDLNPAGAGLPRDWERFNVRVEVDVCFEGHEVDSVFFEFYVASPSALLSSAVNTFMPPTLILEEFNWSEIKIRVIKLLAHANGATSWQEVAFKLNGQMRPVSMSCFPKRMID
ncbi:Imm8 family immunity protein [Motilimonas sp. 1_MG-2023]|uniref:Imm8 family immunity protein n=1 Tax=Motilimonas sp. 1_MG-2023 TaxID=3062672 RepID=UPI0026E3C1D4|nr:Imm8 family immunity protein [Motilimonas sp. 1_MG-2023]MDO6526503.1 Imm8 family immunity protein [Motilimonas sp. 1_MG-2023]